MAYCPGVPGTCSTSILALLPSALSRPRLRNVPLDRSSIVTSTAIRSHIIPERWRKHSQRSNPTSLFYVCWGGSDPSVSYYTCTLCQVFMYKYRYHHNPTYDFLDNLNEYSIDGKWNLIFKRQPFHREPSFPGPRFHTVLGI